MKIIGPTLFHIFRLGGGPNDYKDVIEHKFFESIDFDDLLAKRVRNLNRPRPRKNVSGSLS